MIFDFSDKINQNGLKLIFSNAEESSILTKKSIVSMVQTHSTNIEMVNDKKLAYSNVDGIFSCNKNYALQVKTADCLPIFFVHEYENDRVLRNPFLFPKMPMLYFHHLQIFHETQALFHAVLNFLHLTFYS